MTTTTVRSAVAVAAFALAAAVGTHRAGAGESMESASASCTPKFYDDAMHLCGPAVAHFRGFTFRRGTCKPASPSRGTRAFVLELGELHPGAADNGGKPYLKIEIDGPFTHPTSGTVISWLGGTRWSGYGKSFTPTFVAGKFAKGKFVATASAAGGGPRTGSFECAR